MRLDEITDHESDKKWLERRIEYFGGTSDSSSDSMFDLKMVAASVDKVDHSVVKEVMNARKDEFMRALLTFVKRVMKRSAETGAPLSTVFSRTIEYTANLNSVLNWTELDSVIKSLKKSSGSEKQ